MVTPADKSQRPSLLQRLQQGELLISDGGTGTFLQQHGLEPGGCPEEFNASQPDTVKGMARAYFDAGSDMVLTNSFGGNKFMLAKYGHGHRVEELNKLAAQHARSQTPLGKFVIGSVGPTGEFLEPLGNVSETEMLEAFIAQVVALEQGGADAIVIETMTSIEECSLAIKAARDYTSLTIMATMVFDLGPRGFFTMMGDTPEKAVEFTQTFEPRLAAIGANCGAGPAMLIDTVARLCKSADDQDIIIAKGNCGIPQMSDGEIVYSGTNEVMAEYARLARDCGAKIIGGCCGTTPDHILAMRSALLPSR